MTLKTNIKISEIHFDLKKEQKEKKIRRQNLKEQWKWKKKKES